MDVPGGVSPLFGRGAGVFFPYRIRDGLRGRSASARYVRDNRAGASSTTFSFSIWSKRSDFTPGLSIPLSWGQTGAGGNRGFFGVSTGLMIYRRQPASATDWDVQADQVTDEDPTAWVHYLYVFDSTHATSTERVRFYRNGVRVPASGTFPTLNGTTYFHTAGYFRHFNGLVNAAGTYEGGNVYADAHLVDGIACSPEDFGFFKNGIWLPKAYEGLHGTVGWHFDFSDSSSVNAMFTDRSENAYGGFTITGWPGGTTPDGATEIHIPDGPTDPAITLDPLNADYGPGSFTFAEPTQWSTAGAVAASNFKIWNLPIRRGKWVYEYTHASSNIVVLVGVYWETDHTSEKSRSGGNARLYYGSNGNKYTSPPSSNAAYGATWGVNDIIGVVFDLDVGTIEFFKNGVSQGVAYNDLPTDGESIVFPVMDEVSTTLASAGRVNFFGSPLSRLTYAANYPADAKPLTREAVAATYLDDRNRLIFPSSRSVRSEKRTGTGAAAQIITPTKPDLVLIKNLSTVDGWRVVDSVRGATKTLQLHSTAVEATEAQSVTALGANYFDVGTLAAVNGGGNSILDMTWRRGAPTGLDIVTYTGNGTANRTIGHALGRVPAFAIIKSLDAVGGWFVWHRRLTSAAHFLRFDTTALESNTNSPWGTGGWTAIDFMVSADATNNANALGVNYVAYLFAEIEGFSRFTSYTGSGAINGAPVRFFGFLPEIVIMKTISTTTRDWRIFTRAQNPFNIGDNTPRQTYLSQLAAVEQVATSRFFDWRSWGLRVTGGGAGMNNAGEKVIIAAWARAPYKYSMAA